MPKRGQGEGSIYQRNDGRWEASISLGWENGRRRRKSFYGRTRREVQEALTRALRDQQMGLPVATKRQTAGEFLQFWLKSIKPDVRPATYVSYEGTVRLHLTPAFGRIPLSRLQAQHVERFKQDELAVGTSPRTVQYSLLVLRMALADACKQDLVPRNVATLVDYPKVEHDEIQPFTPEEAKCFLAVADQDRLGALFSVALALGLRKGEALGLRWTDIDLESCVLHVNSALQRIKMPDDKKGRLVLNEPKRGSRRAIMVPQVTMAALWAHRARQGQERELAGDRWKESGYVFTTTIGTPLDPRKPNVEFEKLTKRAGLRRIRVHDLRHTCASLLLAQGVSLKAIQGILGHSDIRITMNLYAHLYPEAKREAADRMDAILVPHAPPVAVSVAVLGTQARPN